MHTHDYFFKNDKLNMNFSKFFESFAAQSETNIFCHQQSQCAQAGMGMCRMLLEAKRLK
jgi:hypothetical protein